MKPLPEIRLMPTRPALDVRPLEKRVGLIILATDHTSEPDFRRMTGLWLETMGLEITESILITETGVECLANVPRKLVVKN